MFNISSDLQAKPITSKQLAYLPRLISRVGKAEYLDIKKQLGLQAIGLTRLSSGQASRLIEALRKQARR